MIRVRPALLADLEGIQAVLAKTGLSVFDAEERRRWLLRHPFREEFEGVPIGWVLETQDGKIVGTFSNIHMMYEIDGRRFKCGVAGSWGVDAEYRNSSLLLAMSYFNQKGVDFCFSGSASSISSRLMPVLKAERIPSRDYDLGYFWITRHRTFAEAVLRKKKIPAAGVLAPAVGLGLKATDRRRRHSAQNCTSLKRFAEFGEEFDEFWQKLRQGRGRLRAVRTSAVLDWRFGSALRQHRAVVLGLLRGEELYGYVVLCEKDREQLKLRQFVVADLQVLDDSSDQLVELLEAALEATRQEQLDALEWQGWNQAKRKQALSLNPRSYRYPVWPLYYKAIDPNLIPVLERADSWDFSPFDAF
jgi:hypothetical protein